MQCPNLPTIWLHAEHPHTRLIHPGFIHEDALLSAQDWLPLALTFNNSKQHRSREQRTIVSRHWSMHCDGCVFQTISCVKVHVIRVRYSHMERRIHD